VRLLALILAALPIGHSVDGRTMRPIVLGSPSAEHRVLVVGCIHGTERAGLTIVRRLLATGAPAGTEIVVLPVLNADGCAKGRRYNEHHVDLNRSFPTGWQHSRISGPRPRSEPETRYAMKLIEAVQPEITIWFHQPEGVVRAWGPSIPTARRFAHLARYPYRNVVWPVGSATRWQNHTFPGTAAFVVELPPGPATHVDRWVHAIRAIAQEGVRG
jgi:murein peptide amidase A